MAFYQIDFARSAVRDLRRVNREFVPRLLQAIEGLSETPRPPGSRKLVGSERTWRVRVGDYRIVYTIDDANESIGIEPVRHRKEAYS